jgi:hypothetical protein
MRKRHCGIEHQRDAERCDKCGKLFSCVTPSDKSGYVYIAQMIIPEYAHHPIKIGISRQPAKRHALMNGGYPFPIAWLAQWESADAWTEEQAAHERFAAYRLQGEWFHPSPAIMNWVRTRILETSKPASRVDSPMSWDIQEADAYVLEVPPMFDPEWARREARRITDDWRMACLTEEEALRVFCVQPSVLAEWRSVSIIWTLPIKRAVRYPKAAIENMITHLETKIAAQAPAGMW